MTKDTPRTDAFMLEINEGRVYATKGLQEEFARDLERDLAACCAALRELVACKDLEGQINKDRESCYRLGTAPSQRLFDEIYDCERRTPLAWAAARAILPTEGETQ